MLNHIHFEKLMVSNDHDHDKNDVQGNISKDT